MAINPMIEFIQSPAAKEIIKKSITNGLAQQDNLKKIELLGNLMSNNNETPLSTEITKKIMIALNREKPGLYRLLLDDRNFEQQFNKVLQDICTELRREYIRELSRVQAGADAKNDAESHIVPFPAPGTSNQVLQSESDHLANELINVWKKSSLEIQARISLYFQTPIEKREFDDISKLFDPKIHEKLNSFLTDFHFVEIFRSERHKKGRGQELSIFHQMFNQKVAHKLALENMIKNNARNVNFQIRAMGDAKPGFYEIRLLGNPTPNPDTFYLNVTPTGVLQITNVGGGTQVSVLSDASQLASFCNDRVNVGKPAINPFIVQLRSSPHFAATEAQGMVLLQDKNKPHPFFIRASTSKLGLFVISQLTPDQKLDNYFVEVTAKGYQIFQANQPNKSNEPLNNEPLTDYKKLEEFVRTQLNQNQNVAPVSAARAGDKGDSKDQAEQDKIKIDPYELKKHLDALNLDFRDLTEAILLAKLEKTHGLWSEVKGAPSYLIEALQFFSKKPTSSARPQWDKGKIAASVEMAKFMEKALRLPRPGR